MAKGKIKKFSVGTPGPKPQAGPRFPSGKLKFQPTPPNERVMQARKALGIDEIGYQLTPVSYAARRKWISGAEMTVATVYAEVHRGANLGSPGMSSQRDESVSTGASGALRAEWSSLTDAEVLALKWREFTDKEMAAIWDSAFKPNASSAVVGKQALRKWKVMASAMTAAERKVVDPFVLYDAWPQWIMQRAQGVMDGPFEGDRSILLIGLRKMAMALRSMKTQAANDHHGNDNACGQAKRDVA